VNLTEDYFITQVLTRTILGNLAMAEGIVKHKLSSSTPYR